MAEFPIQTARQELGFTPTAAVRADIDVRTGEEAIGRAVAGLGRGILGLGREFNIINAKTQLSEQNIAASDEINKYFLELQANDDPETYEKSLNGLFGTLDSLVPTNRMAAQVYNQRLARLKLSVAKETRTVAEKKIISNAQAADFLMFQKAKDTGNFIDYKASIINGVKLGTYNAKEGERLLDDADKERLEADKKLILDSAMQLPLEQGIDLINKSGLSIKDATSVRQELTVQKAAIQKEAEDALEIRREQDRAFLNDKKRNGLLPTWDEIDNTQLSETEKDVQFSKVLAEAARIEKRQIAVTFEPTYKRLDALALDVADGTITKQEFDKSLDDARFPKVGPPMLSDQDYQELGKLAEQQFKGGQVAVLKRANTEAGRVLIEISDEVAWQQFLQGKPQATQETAIQKRKIQFNHLAEYNRQMRVILTDTPDIKIEALSNVAERLKNDFQARDIDEIERILAIRRRDLSGAPLPEHLRRLNTAEAYEKGKELGYWN